MPSVWPQIQLRITFSKKRKMVSGDFSVGKVNCWPGEAMKFYCPATNSYSALLEKLKQFSSEC